MKEKTLKTLEYYKIIDFLLEEAESSLGKELIAEIRPISNMEEIDFLQRETEEGFRMLVKRSSPPLFGINDLRHEMERLKIGGSLEAYHLLKVTDSLRVARSLKNFIRDDKGDQDSTYPILEAYIRDLMTFKRIEDEINQAIISQEEISDNASPSLRNIRREQKSKNDSIRSKLNGIINSQSNSKILQDNIVTMREGRYVVPVKQEYKSSFPGIMHDMSTSGATVFIEPMAIVNLNNDLRELEVKEREEIKKILERLSNLVAEEADAILNNQEILQRLDFIFAKSKYALKINGTRPILNEKGYINIRKGRHPLLDPKKVVPIDIYLGKEFNTLVVTGPNTGGKTVSLKTVGLLSLMAQSGLFIPADFNSEIAVFQQIFADIGDEQSIEQSLSTFSSHMTNIVDILDEIDQDSLVLFDELGAGTDPTEGAALAMSILDHLLRRNIRTIATTHYSQLKVYALTTEKVKNASVEFDVNTLSPTYKLLIGVPGKSNAFEISQRLGLQDYIIDSARKLISEENIEFEDVLQSLEKDRILAEENRIKAESSRRKIERLEEELKEKESKLDNTRETTIKKAKEEARKILREAKLEADSIVDELKGISSDINKERQEKIKAGHEKIKGSLSGLESDLASELLDVKSDQVPKDLKIGETVRVLTFDQDGQVLEGPNDKGDVVVQVGIMKINTNINALKRSKSRSEEESQTKTRHIIKKKARSVPREIDLRGLALDEAILEVDKYIDDAYIAGLEEVEIIHGKGTGILRAGINNYLKTNRNIESFRLGKFNEGGDGVTIASLKH